MDVEVFEAPDGVLVVLCPDAAALDRLRVHPLLSRLGDGCVPVCNLSDALVQSLTGHGYGVAQQGDVGHILRSLRAP